MTEQQNRGRAGASEGALPPLAPPEAGRDERDRAIMARLVARHGAPTLEHYRRTYASAGLDWPGDEEIRRRHPVADEHTASSTADAADPAA